MCRKNDSNKRRNEKNVEMKNNCNILIFISRHFSAFLRLFPSLRSYFISVFPDDYFHLYHVISLLFCSLRSLFISALCFTCIFTFFLFSAFIFHMLAHTYSNLFHVISLHFYVFFFFPHSYSGYMRFSNHFCSASPSFHFSAFSISFTCLFTRFLRLHNHFYVYLLCFMYRSRKPWKFSGNT